MKFVTGNLLEAKTQALVNTVNTVGVMGKGIALQFKEAFPENFRIYAEACKKKELVPGKLLVVKETKLDGEKIIINFPTKTEWFLKSKYEYVEEGLKALVKVIEDYKIYSISIPPLGCGNGGLQWSKVKPLIEKYLGHLQDVDIQIYEPSQEIKALLKSHAQTREVSLTPARAMLLYSMFYYETLGENSSLFVANKLAYFLQRLGDKNFSKLKFQASHYGPYSVQVEHMLHNLNGKYIKGLEQMNVKPFETLELQYDRTKEVSDYIRRELSQEQKTRLKNLIALIEGFQSALSLEVLATVDFVRKDKPDLQPDDIIKVINDWSVRKQKLFQERYVYIAFNHLHNYANKFHLI
ncbi:MAG: macro domain-containing protein [Ignavibacteria bacterium]|jgi:O-acetyl-ADP-ribose deacetylase (regulator of RNase III)|nr:macro domain-containing protein [Ignavibacteria bacterium]MCU7501183.1 macro domain-containing protein [Ignavibacteria bacterium]MCU7521133.1 macro domain-containing protein [Ignavibacteria bacterium]MCU7526513.1 macro domain-containing protein [Ignavibacteria bacterium]